MPRRLPYAANDDRTAVRYVREALRRSDRGNWAGLLADDRIMQTYRVLRQLESNAAKSHIQHRDAIRQAEADRDAGLLSHEKYAEEHRDFVDWRLRAAVFDGVLRQYLDMVRERLRVLRRDPVLDSLRQTLLALALAVDSHRVAHSGEESLADTALWARLHTLSWPIADGTEFCTLADAVAAENARRGPARVNNEGFLVFEGLHFYGETVDVAAMILELTDHTNISVPRPKLVDRWKERTPDLAATDAAKVTATRQVGSYASHRLRKALQFLENLGAITRETENTDLQITVTDRAKLAELRRRWDDKYFGVYDLECLS